MVDLEFITPKSGDWLIVKDVSSDEVIYSGHGSGDQIYAILNYLRVTAKFTELPDEQFEEEYV
jgi:hypothetical protein